VGVGAAEAERQTGAGLMIEDQEYKSTSEAEYDRIAEGLGKIAQHIESGLAHGIEISSFGISGTTLRIPFSTNSLMANFIKRYWGIQLRVIQNQIEQRVNGSLDYPRDGYLLRDDESEADRQT
jgi:hypothetical protein